jgi:tripartite-type tricarboxylate transporter receptor subunit TctC
MNGKPQRDRGIVAATLAALFLALAGLAASAQDYPTRIIRLIVPYPPGGPTDVIARIVANSIAPILGQGVVVESRPGGAGGTVGGKYAASADPDGYTLLISIAGSLTITPSIYKLEYDPLKDLAPIAIVAQSPEILTLNPDVPGRSLAEFIAYAKTVPGKLNLASPGTGTLPHLLGELLQLDGHIKLTHVPYRGAGPAIIDLLAGQVQAMFNNPSVVLADIQAGKLRALGVTSDSRTAQIPDVPTFAEMGYPRLTATEWLGILAPAGTPEPIIQKLNAAINEGLKPPDVQASLNKLGVETRAVSPAQFKSFMAAETQKWAQVVAQAGIKGE